MGCPRVRELWALLCGLEVESSSIARMGADRGPWDPRGSEGKRLICCIVHRHPSSCSGPDPVPAPYHPQSLSCTNPSLSSIPVSYQFCSQSQSQSQFQRQSQLSPNPISVLVSGPAQTNSSSTVSPIPSPAQHPRRGRNSHPSHSGGVSDRKTTKALDRKDGSSAMDCETKKGKKVCAFWGHGSSGLGVLG